MSDRAITIYCGLMLALVAFSIDITLPFFGDIRDAMSANDEATHAVITLNIFFLGLGQLFFGPFSDRFGRRPAMALGMSIFIVGSVVCLLATDMTVLLIGRALQGLGGSVSPVTARSIMRDRYRGNALAKAMAVTAAIFSAGPIAAPILGVALVSIGGDWRIIFVAMALFGLGLLLTLLRLPETLAQTQNDALELSAMTRNSKAMFKNPQSRHFLFVMAWAMVAIIIIITGLPPIMEHEYGITGTEFALSFAFVGLGIILGQMFNHRMIDRIGVVPSSIVANWIMIAAFACAVLATALGLLSGYGLMALMFVFSFGHSTVMSNAGSLTLEPHGQFAGFASALMGSFAQIFASTVTSVILWYTGSNLLYWTSASLAVCFILLLSLLNWQRRNASTSAA